MSKELDAKKPSRLDFYPFAYALYNEELNAHCWYCLSGKQGLRHCTGCGVALFCDKSCQSLAWKDHKAECKGIATHRFVANIEVRLLGRIVLRFKDITKGRDKKDPTFYENRTSKRSIMEIWSHAEHIKKDEQALKKFEEIYQKLSLYYDDKFLLPKEAIFELHCRDFINRHAISDKGYLNEIGKGLYLDLCAYDHSCAPNTIYTCKGFVATLRPLNNSVNLLDRSKTFYSYIELFSTKQQRRKMLRDTWYFQCECTRCADNDDHILTAMKCPLCPEGVETRMAVFGQQPYKDKQTQMLTCPNCKNEIPQQSVMEHIHAMRFVEDIFARKEIEQMSPKMGIEFLESLISRYRVSFPRINLYYCKLIQTLIPLVDPQKTSKLLFLHEEVEECLRICFPHAHPAVAFHLRNTGIFHKNLNHFAEARKYFEEAQSILEYTLDADHPMAVENKQLLAEIDNEFEGSKKPNQKNGDVQPAAINKEETNTTNNQVSTDREESNDQENQEVEPKISNVSEMKEQDQKLDNPIQIVNMSAIADMLEDHDAEMPGLTECN